MQQLTGWLLALLSVAGHTEWWVVTVNRSHALPIRSEMLRKFRSLHDIAVLGYPFFLLWLLGFENSSLLTGGRFSDQTAAVQGLLIVTICGCIPLVLGIIRWHWIRGRQFHQADQKQHHDVVKTAADSDGISHVKGPRRHVSQLWPWNQIYHLEVNQKTIRLLSPEKQSVDGGRPLRIVHFSDLHFIGCPGNGYYEFMVSQAVALKPDVFVFTGDLIDKMELLDTAVSTLRPLTDVAPCYFILGNHDWKYQYETIRAAVSASGWKCVTGSHEIVTVAGRKVLLAGSERPWMGDVPPAVRDAGCDLRILLSHSPDQYLFAQRSGYDVMLSGHTHGGQVVLPLIGPVYSPSIFGVSYVSGLFQLGDLTMHVSRGIGGKDPMRWRCSPELTCLEIHC
jgi:predicted MPP superfamily phosphohydrolase